MSARDNFCQNEKRVRAFACQSSVARVAVCVWCGARGHTSSNRNADQIIHKGPAKVNLNAAVCAPRDIECSHNVTQVALHQDDICTVNKQ